MMTRQDDVVVAYRFGQEITHAAGIVEADDLLGAA